MYTINQGTPYIGIAAVMSYLQNNVAKDKEQFLPTLQDICWQSKTTVVGRAIWVDIGYPGCDPNNPANTCGTINYMFRFTSQGLIDRMIGTPD
jgi:hypothetical protein